MLDAAGQEDEAAIAQAERVITPPEIQLACSNAAPMVVVSRATRPSASQARSATTRSRWPPARCARLRRLNGGCECGDVVGAVVPLVVDKEGGGAGGSTGAPRSVMVSAVPSSADLQSGRKAASHLSGIQTVPFRAACLAAAPTSADHPAAEARCPPAAAHLASASTGIAAARQAADPPRRRMATQVSQGTDLGLSLMAPMRAHR